jgi:hypothetical protein
MIYRATIDFISNVTQTRSIVSEELWPMCLHSFCSLFYEVVSMQKKERRMVE